MGCGRNALLIISGEKEICHKCCKIEIIVLVLEYKQATMILAENNTHKAVQNGNVIDIILKGFTIEDYSCKDELLYSIPMANIDDLFDIFEKLDEENRINRSEGL